MDLKQHYTALYNESIEKIVTNTYQIDNQIDSLSDRRFGITLLIRPDSQTKKKHTGLFRRTKANRSRAIVLSQFGYSHHRIINYFLLRWF